MKGFGKRPGEKGWEAFGGLNRRLALFKFKTLGF